MFSKKIAINKNLFQKLSQAAEALGCSSVDEFVERTLEQEAQRILSESTPEAQSETEAQRVAEKLKGLGYME